MEKPKVTIVVAIYNTGKYLNRCIDSLVNQTLKEIEIILIDDGSSDDSGKICDEYASQDSRIKVFHRTNHGLAASRKFGLEHASGTYLIQADSDDWVDLDMYEKMYDVAIRTKADVVFCDYYEEKENKSIRHIQKPSSNESEEVLLELFTTLSRICCNKLILLESIKKYQVDWVEGVDAGEDILFNVRLFQNPLNVAYCPSVAYHWDIHSNDHSLSRTINPLFIEKRNLLIRKLREYQTTDKITQGILRDELFGGYYAIKINVYPRQKYYEVFSHLAGANILKLPGCPMGWKIIVWSAFNVSYGTARFLMFIKNSYRKIIKC